MKKSTLLISLLVASFCVSAQAAPTQLSLTEMQAVVAGEFINVSEYNEALFEGAKEGDSYKSKGVFAIVSEVETVTVTTSSGPGNSANSNSGGNGKGNGGGTANNPNQTTITTETTTVTVDTFRGNPKAGNSLEDLVYVYTKTY